MAVSLSLIFGKFYFNIHYYVIINVIILNQNFVNTIKMYAR